MLKLLFSLMGGSPFKLYGAIYDKISELTKCFNTRLALINSPLTEVTMTTHILTQEELKSQLHYEPDTGIFTWLVSNSNRIKIGDVAGCKTARGYITIRVFNKSYTAHRLAWLYITGEWPKDQIDHVNRVKHDNRICNIRDVTGAENCMNIQGKGYFVTRGGKFQVSIQTDRRKLYLGAFQTEVEASNAYIEAKLKYHGIFFHNEKLA